MFAITVVLLLGGCAPDRIEVEGSPPPTIAAATAGSCDPAGMYGAWQAFAQQFNDGSVDVDGFFAPDFQVWVDPADRGKGGVSRPRLVRHFADLYKADVRLPTEADFELRDGNAGTYEFDAAGFHAFGQLKCVTGRIRTMDITNWPPEVAGREPLE